MVDALDANLRTTLIFLREGHPLQKVVHFQGATLLHSKKDSSFFNHIIDCRLPELKTDEIIREIHQYFFAENLSFSWWIGPNHSPKHLKELLKGEGLMHQGDAKVLQINLTSWRKLYPENLKIQKISTLVEWKKFAALQSLSRNEAALFDELDAHMPIAMGQEGQPVEFFLGTLNEIPLTCGGLTCSSGIAQIHSLCTHPYFQHRGYAREMVQFLLQKSKDAGYLSALLLSAEKQCPFYEKLGFVHVTQYEEYAL